MKLHVKSPGKQPGLYTVAERGKDLKYLSFRIAELQAPMREQAIESRDEELCLNFYGGPVRVEVETGGKPWSTEISRRPSLGEPAPMVYVPANARVKLAIEDGSATVTVAGAAGKPGVAPGKLDGVPKNVGKDNWSRTVFTHIADNVPAAHLICGETVNRPGGWSSCPPHKHDRFAPPAEVPMEEIYYFQLEPAQGFGFIRIYTDPADPNPFDSAFAVENGDTVLIPRGYHPVVACPGYTLNYAWFLAGEGRSYGAWSDDPRHAWIKN